MEFRVSFYSSASVPRWQQTLPRTVPRLLARWLGRPGSLTAWLQTLGVVEVRVIKEGLAITRGGFPSSGAHVFSGAVWARETVLSVDGVPVVAARSTANSVDARAAWRRLKDLGSKPLATILYSDPTVSRSAFSYMPLGRPPFLSESDRELKSSIRAWARSSVFYRKGSPLMVSEVFSPDLLSFLKTKDS
ncbi:chorismate--pyruvate lyase family protein [Paraburkholderia hospita]|uniref:chorismate--pyruvate lyase family protein n=1 Tax=Paraburkholderia hospita TaxID=169430 RepID=UPI000DF01268|nr:chorismate lyase [Paraburkholderia hospita]AXF05621.1 chorismate--pyruvate lyase [Paraburkholderia hospita]